MFGPRYSPTASEVTHCDPPEPDCTFDLVEGWTFEDDHGGAVIRCGVHGLLAPGEVYLLEPADGPVVSGPSLQPKES